VRYAVPEDLVDCAQVCGVRDVRAFGGESTCHFRQDFARVLREEIEEKGLDPEETYSVLAISGGAANGAYGAGLLNGWSDSGTRPVFKVVTGISTGAITAPFAFLGSEYDCVIKEFYTEYSTRDIMRIRFPRFMIPVKSSIATTIPMKRLLNHYIDMEVLKKISAEYRKGRRLYVGTTNMDTQELVVWDMGKIASCENLRSLELFRKIVLASASIPVFFQPIYFRVEIDGKQYEEMHVDGGLSKQVFFIDDVIRGLDEITQKRQDEFFKSRYHLYLIRNGYATPLYEEVPDKIFPIADRALDTLINSQSLGDLYHIYLCVKDLGGDFNLAHIPESHVSHAREFLDPVEMRILFNLGYDEALEGYRWKKSPPAS